MNVVSSLSFGLSRLFPGNTRRASRPRPGISATIAALLAFAVVTTAMAESSCQLTFPNAPATALENFPVLVRISETSPSGFEYADCPTAANLWFEDVGGDTLPFEADTWDTAGESLVWVSVPSFSSATTISMHWSPDSASVPVSPAPSQVWTRAGYNAVWHFSGDATESANGLTVATTHGTPSFDGNSTFPGPLGKTMWLNGSSAIEYAVNSAWTTLGDGSTLTVSCWARSTAGSPGYVRMVSCSSNYKNPQGYELTLQNSFTTITVGSSGTGSNGGQLQFNITTGPNAQWKHFTATFSGTTLALYDNGALAGSGTKNAVATPTESLALGAAGGGFGANKWTGGLDEIRIRAAASTAEWIAEEYATMTDSSYVSFGPVSSGAEALRFSSFETSNVTTSSVVVAGTVAALGAGATSADVWAVYAAGATTGSAFIGTVTTTPQYLQARIDNLAQNTEYTIWLTATNNASPAGSRDTAATTFRTPRSIRGVGFACDLTFPPAPASALAGDDAFPVLVRISETGISGFRYADCQDSDCLWFVDENDEILPSDVDTWNDQGESLVWVSVPSLSSSTTITMRWSNNGAGTTPDPSLVWSRAHYVGVWHMNELVYDSVKAKHYTPDASASGWNAYKVTESDAVPAPVTTAVGASAAPTPLTGAAMNIAYGGALTKDSYGGFAVPMAQTSATTLNGPGFTLSAIVNSQQGANDGRGRVITFGDSYSDKANLTVGNDSIYVMGSNFHNKNHTKGATGWVYAAGVFSSPYSKIYADGVCLSGNNEGNPNLASLALTKGIGLGSFVTGKNSLDGYLDEARVRNAASSAAWIAEEYKTVTTADYVSFGAVQTLATLSAPLEFGPVSVSGVTMTNAMVTARLRSIGDGADNADAWLVVSGFGQTRVFPASRTFIGADTVAIEAAGLQCGAEWTAYMTATNNLGASTNSAVVSFSTLTDGGSAAAGLYQAVTGDQNLPKNAAAGWDIVTSSGGTIITGGPLAMRSSLNGGEVWRSADGSSAFHWADNTGYGYTGYMYMEGGKDYWFGGAIDDQGYVWVDNGDANWDAAYSGSVLGQWNSWAAKGPFAISETGYHRVVFSVWNNSGGAGAEQANNAALIPKLRYAAMESGSSKPGQSSGAWREAQDPGDGSLFIPDAPARQVTVLSADRDGTLLSAKVALAAAYAGETSELGYVYGAAHGGEDPADWEGGAFLSSSLPAEAVTNDYVVGIASDTRYVRFYTRSAGSVNWSATVSIDWASETTIADAFIFIGDPAVSGIRADAATFSALLNAPGADATEAQVWFVVSGGGETFTIPAGSATTRTNLTASITGLTPATQYTVYATTTNNAATPAGADSAIVTFTSGNAVSEWDPSVAVVSFDGRIITATVPVTNIGLGDTTLYLMTGDNKDRENNVAASNAVTVAGVQTIVADVSTTSWGNRVYYSLKLVSGTEGNETTDWPYQSGEAFYNKSQELQDNSTYTWIGGSDGYINDPSNWELTSAGSLAPTHQAGYPVYGSTALFATNIQVTVTVPATQGTTYRSGHCWWISNVDVGGMGTNVVFTSEDKTAAGSQLKIYTFANARTDSRVDFDDCNVWIENVQNVGATAADANGGNFNIVFTGGTTASINGLKVNRPGVKVRVEDGATLSAGGLTGGSAYPPPVLEIDGGSVTAGKLEPDTNNSLNGTTVRLVGAASVFTPDWMQIKYTTSTNVYEFVVPSGGYNAVPVRFRTTGSKLPANTNDAKLTFRVPSDSPGFRSLPGRGIQLLQASAGINVGNIRFEESKPGYNGFFFKDEAGNSYADAAAVTAAGKSAEDITQIWFRGQPSSTVIYMR